MALSDLVIPSEVFAVGGTSISVRGLNVADIAHLYMTNKADVERFAALWEASAGTVTQEFVSALLAELPDLVAKAIACACDEPASWQNARKLPGPTQVAVINAVGRLTFEGVGVKKFLEVVVGLVQSMTAGVKDMTAAIPSTGTGG